MENIYYLGAAIAVVCVCGLVYIALRNRQRLETSYDGENTFDKWEELVRKTEELDRRIQGARNDRTIYKDTISTD